MHRIVILSRLLAGVVPVVAAAATAVPAHAGTYVTTATCGNWDAVNNDPMKFAVYTSCPTLTARNVVGNRTTPPGIGGAWVFSAPPGSSIQTVQLGGYMVANSGWQSTIYLQGGPASGSALENCPSASCPGGQRFFDWATYGGAGADAIIARVRCGAADSCHNGEIRGYVQLWTSWVTIADGSPPSASASGALASGGWKSGTVPVVVSAADNVGVKQTRALVDGVPKAAQGRACDYARKVPCPNGADALNVPLGGLADGTHTLGVQAVDSADNLGGSEQAISVDNTPPVAPVAASLAGGPGWRSENRWSVEWSNPAQKFAPIAAVRYELCPIAAFSNDPKVAAKAKQHCESGMRSKTGVQQITDLSLPGPGEWTLRLWLVDAAGNHNPDAAVQLDGLGFDPSPPSDVAFLDPDPSDPARLRVAATDGVSGIASGAIEVRRHGRDVWRPLPTEARAPGLTALMNDEVLPRGRYDLRAVAVNGAGLQQGTTVRLNRSPATIRLPVRTGARLVAGRYVRRCRESGCRAKIVRRIRGHADRATRIRGRLTSRHKPIANQSLQVWQRLATSTAAWKRAGTVKTGRSGRFRYKARRGPARAIRFRYPGTAQTQGDNATVDLRVPARTSMRVSRGNVVNGEYATFSGRIRGGWMPPEGTLVELQVYTRGRWRTFAQPRADAKSGRWEFQYRFETIRGKVTFRFRARIRRQSNYPFDTGHSRTLRVTVQGL